MTEVAEKLKEARALIERGWCQNSYARDSINRPSDPDGQESTHYCINGALMRSIGTMPGSYRIYLSCKDTLKQLASTESTMNWNDAPGRTQAEVLDLFDRAIAKAQEQGV